MRSGSHETVVLPIRAPNRRPFLPYTAPPLTLHVSVECRALNRFGHILLTPANLCLASAPEEAGLTFIRFPARLFARAYRYQPWMENPVYLQSWRLFVRSSAASPDWLRQSRHWNGGWTVRKAVALASQVSWRRLRMSGSCRSRASIRHINWEKHELRAPAQKMAKTAPRRRFRHGLRHPRRLRAPERTLDPVSFSRTPATGFCEPTSPRRPFQC